MPIDGTPTAAQVSFDPTGLTQTEQTDVQGALEDFDQSLDNIGAARVTVSTGTFTGDDVTTSFPTTEFIDPELGVIVSLFQDTSGIEVTWMNVVDPYTTTIDATVGAPVPVTFDFDTAPADGVVYRYTIIEGPAA